MGSKTDRSTVEISSTEVHRKKGKGLRFIVQFLLLVACAVFFSSFIWKQTASINKLSAEIKSVDDELANAQSITGELENEAEYHESDEFIEKIARERLGLIKRDEIIYIINK